MNIKLFDRWDISQIIINEPGLKEYINIKSVIVPRSSGRHTHVRFHKNKYSIVERLMNRIMIPGHKGKTHRISSGHCSGKSIQVYNIVEKAFGIIEKRTNKNPIEVFVAAVENAAPREEITTIEYGGARYPQAVECSPQRRIDLALRFMTQGAYQSSFRSRKKIEESIADEIIFAYNLDNKSTAIAKKLELERQSDASR